MPTRQLLFEGETIDPSVSRADGGRRVARRHGGARAGARPRRVAIERVRDSRPSPPRPLQPLVECVERKFAHSLMFVLPEQDRAGLAQFLCDERVLRRDGPFERERARRGRHPVGGADVVLEENRDAVQRPAHPARLPLGVALGGNGERVGVGLEHLPQRRALAVERSDACEVLLRDGPRRLRAGGHPLLQGRDRHLLELERRHRDAGWPRSPAALARRPHATSGRDRHAAEGAGLQEDRRSRVCSLMGIRLLARALRSGRVSGCRLVATAVGCRLEAARRKSNGLRRPLRHPHGHVHRGVSCIVHCALRRRIRPPAPSPVVR